MEFQATTLHVAELSGFAMMFLPPKDVVLEHVQAYQERGQNRQPFRGFILQAVCFVSFFQIFAENWDNSTFYSYQ